MSLTAPPVSPARARWCLLAVLLLGAVGALALGLAASASASDSVDGLVRRAFGYLGAAACLRYAIAALAGLLVGIAPASAPAHVLRAIGPRWVRRLAAASIGTAALASVGGAAWAGAPPTEAPPATVTQDCSADPAAGDLAAETARPVDLGVGIDPGSGRKTRPTSAPVPADDVGRSDAVLVGAPGTLGAKSSPAPLPPAGTPAPPEPAEVAPSAPAPGSADTPADAATGQAATASTTAATAAGHPLAPPPEGEPAPSAAPDPVPDPVAATYTVQRGDSLWRIAERHGATGNAEIAAAWPRWYELNRDVIGSDPDLIHPGQVLQVPAALALGAGS